MAQLPAQLKTDPDPGQLTKAERSDLWHSLTELQQEWIVAYLSNGRNATEAAITAGYEASSQHAFQQIGYRNKNHNKISRLIGAVGATIKDAEEAMAELASLADGDMQDFLTIDVNGDPMIDLEKAKARGKMHLVKDISIERTEDPETGEVTTDVDLTLYDRRKVLNDLLDFMGAGEEDEGGDTYQQFNFQLDQHHKGEVDLTEQVDNEL